MEEKSSRVVELTASSVRPIQLLIGRYWDCRRGADPSRGVGHYACVAGNGWPYRRQCRSRRGAPYGFAILIPLFHPVLILGFLIFATLYAAIGSTAESASDVQQVAFPVILLVIPFGLLSSVIQNPSTTKNVILSLIPFFSPTLMLARIFTETPPKWQTALVVVLMIGTFFGCLWVGGKNLSRGNSDVWQEIQTQRDREVGEVFVVNLRRDVLRTSLRLQHNGNLLQAPFIRTIAQYVPGGIPRRSR